MRRDINSFEVTASMVKKAEKAANKVMGTNDIVATGYSVSSFENGGVVEPEENESNVEGTEESESDKEEKEELAMLKSDKCLNYRSGEGDFGNLAVREKLIMLDSWSYALECVYELYKSETDIVGKMQLCEARRNLRRVIDEMECELDEIARRFGMKLEEEYVCRTANGSLYATYFIRDEYGIERF